MKFKVFIILIMVFVLCGCTNVNKMSLDDCVNTITTSSVKKFNVVRRGYNFYLPQGLKIEEAGNSYVILSSNHAKYYMYIDFISYANKSTFSYKKSDDAIYGSNINYDNKQGYIEVKLTENDKYLIEIMYNYAKIEVMVDEEFANKAIINSMNILNSIIYKDLTIEDMLNDDNLDYTEEKFDIFDNSKVTSSKLEFVDTNDEEEDEVLKDTDYVD